MKRGHDSRITDNSQTAPVMEPGHLIARLSEILLAFETIVSLASIPFERNTNHHSLVS